MVLGCAFGGQKEVFKKNQQTNGVRLRLLWLLGCKVYLTSAHY